MKLNRWSVLVAAAGDSVAVVTVVPVENAIAGKRLTLIEQAKGCHASWHPFCLRGFEKALRQPSEHRRHHGKWDADQPANRDDEMVEIAPSMVQIAGLRCLDGIGYAYRRIETPRFMSIALSARRVLSHFQHRIGILVPSTSATWRLS